MTGVNGDNHQIGRTIGPYTLVELLGEGGMGEVFLAEQTEPFKRQVALKIVKLGMDTREFTRRFESERQALAMMDHPYIARVFDAGATDNGRPFVVMEHVRGIPLIRYCDENALDLDQRLDLFVKVCEGLQHAHQKAIIHRDIKSSNVLVYEEDGEPLPKIIDFGVAKAIGDDITERTIQTEVGQLLGTLEYMSPEQTAMTGSNVDTRTDIYLLGEMLYELLAGVTAFDIKEMRASGLEGILYKIQTVDPPRPTRRLSELGPAAEPPAVSRRTTVDRLLKRLSGDLDWIVMMCLEKSPELRYQTVQALIQDIRNHLNHWPIQASPPTTSYRVRKFVNRHRTGVVAAGFVAAAVVLGIIGTTVGMIRAMNSESLARTEAETAHEVSDFMVGLFEVSDPGEARGNSVTAREILDTGMRKVKRDLEGQPATQARLMNSMGRVYMELGLYRDAQPLLEQSLAGMRNGGEGKSLGAATVMNDLGHLLREQGDFDQAEDILNEALEIRMDALGSEDPLVGECYNSLGNLLYAKGDYPEAKVAYQRSLEIRERALGHDHKDVAITLKNLGGTAISTGDYEEARGYLEESLDIRQRVLPPDHPDISHSLNALGTLLSILEESDRAAEMHQRALVIREKVYGPEHPMVAESVQNLALAMLETGDVNQAIVAYRRALAIEEKALGPDHPEVADILVALAEAQRNAGDLSGALRSLDRCRGIVLALDGEDSARMAEVHGEMGLVMLDEGDPQGALEQFHQSERLYRQYRGADYPGLVRTYYNMGHAYVGLGDVAHAAESYRKGLKLAEEQFGEDHPDVSLCLLGIGFVELQTGELDSAGRHFQRGHEIRLAAYGPDHIQTAESYGRLGLHSYYAGELATARDMFGKALEIQVRLLPAGNPAVLENHYNLACLNTLLDNQDKALGHLESAVADGFSHPAIMDDPDLSALHGDPRFEALVARMN